MRRDLSAKLPALRVRSAAPTFLVSDVAATAAWYTEQLGFSISGTFPSDPPYGYSSLQFGGAELMLLRLSDYEKPDLTGRRPEGLWDAYIRVDGVALLYAQLDGEAFMAMPLTQRPYGDWEFAVRDPNGYTLVFGGA